MNAERTFILIRAAAIGLVVFIAVALVPGCGLLDRRNAQRARARQSPGYGRPFNHRLSATELREHGYQRTDLLGRPVVDPPGGSVAEQLLR